MTTTKPSSADIETEWTRLANLVPLVRYCLEPRASVEAGRGKPESRPPMNITASDLLAEINDEVGFYVDVLKKDTHNFRAPATLEGRILAVRDRHGHFLTETYRSGKTILNTAKTLNSKAHGLAIPSSVPKFGGPCPVDECTGTLKIHDDGRAIKCNHCAHIVTRYEWNQLVEQVAATWEAPKTQIKYLLRVSGYTWPTPKAIDHWITRRHIVGREALYIDHEGAIKRHDVYRMAEVIEYVKSRRESRRRMAA